MFELNIKPIVYIHRSVRIQDANTSIHTYERFEESLVCISIRYKEAQMFLHIFLTIGHSDRMNDEQLSRALSKMEIQKKERKPAYDHLRLLNNVSTIWISIYLFIEVH